MKYKTLTAGAAAAILCAAVLTGSSPEEVPEDSSSPAGFVLADYGGQVAVFRSGGGPAPDQVTAIRVQLLPSPDRQRLTEGIPVAGETELAMLLEDLSR